MRTVNQAGSSRFVFRDPGRLQDDELILVLTRTVPADPVRGYSPFYAFEMRHARTRRCLGTIRLRIDTARRLRFPGHLGFSVRPTCRGHHYAARSCRLLMELARGHGLKALWVTAQPGNRASQQSVLRAGGRFVETVRVPAGHEMHRQGVRYLRRYRISLTDGCAAGGLPGPILPCAGEHG